LQIGLAGNLRDYVLISHSGEAKKGSEICTFDGSPVGYTSSPIETVFLFFDLCFISVFWFLWVTDFVEK
jgi:hypothetical protein